MDWKDVGNKILGILGPASTIAAPFLGPAGALLPVAIKALSGVLGISEEKATPDAIMAAMQLNPQAAADLAKAQMLYEHELAMKQMEYEAQSRTEQAGINMQDAKDLRFWNSGWRPYIGWILGTSLGAYYIPQSIVATVVWVMSIATNGWKIVPYPNTFDMGELITLLLGMLGLGGIKAFEKVKGVAK